MHEEPHWWQAPLQDFKRETDWLHEKSEELLEYLALPVLHLFAAALNFCMILVTARPIFSLPFGSLKEVMKAKALLTELHARPPPSAGPASANAARAATRTAVTPSRAGTAADADDTYQPYEGPLEPTVPSSGDAVWLKPVILPLNRLNGARHYKLPRTANLAGARFRRKIPESVR